MLELDAQLRWLADAGWWRKAIAACFKFAPRCWIPALMVTIANVSIMCTYASMDTQVTALKTSSDLSNLNLIPVVIWCVVAFLVCVASMILVFAAINIWLAKLHAFALAFWRTLDSESTALDFSAAGSEIANRKNFLRMFWLVGSVYLVVPALVFAFPIGIRKAAGLEVAGQSLVVLPPGASLETYALPLNMLTAFGLVLILAYSLFAIVVAAIAPAESPGRLATWVLRQTATPRGFLSTIVLTLVVTAINAVVTLPFTIASAALPNAHLDNNIPFILVSQLWLGVTSLVIWPLSVAPFCMILRKKPGAPNE